MIGKPRYNVHHSMLLCSRYPPIPANILRLLTKSFLPMLMTPSGESVNNLSSVTLTASKTADRFSPYISDRQWFDMVSENFDILPLWGLFGIMKQIRHTGGSDLMKWILARIVPVGLYPRESHLPSGMHSINYPHWDVIFV